ncbi:hypothetical protein CU669_19015 [Paramagnetospirillum kuznetsovii]|uniref:BioF2-like acetyltransferase domain-containing protein n=2 Tax=Paramagnetospirillum kuznetsovii TaxID=2053833 RepID=A0A364NTZ0_9PROT|nr:hypothetical protein CU669_19015 [Paramagnetospirillum kuznetsovii]
MADDTGAVDCYRAAYFLAQRRPPLPDEMFLRALHEGSIDAFVGHFEGQLAALVLTSHHGSVTYDMATCRDVGSSRPFSHCLVHVAILQAMAKGRRMFHFGPLYEDGDDKMCRIAEFKRGFASSFGEYELMKLFR